MMGTFEIMKKLGADKEVTECVGSIVDDAIDFLLGDTAAIGRITYKIAQMPFFIHEKLFWEKMELMLSGSFSDKEEQLKFAAKLTENGKNGDNPRRLIECIDRIDTKKKIGYLINATRCFLADFIDLNMYFRLCHLITNTLYEDILFLRENIVSEEEYLPYSIEAESLTASGLMYKSIIGGKEDKYSFTPIAEDFDKYAVSYDDVDRYPNPVLDSGTGKDVKTLVDGPKEATDEEAAQAITAVFG